MKIHILLCFSVSGFEFTSESGLFDLLDVALYHGWVVDPQDENTYNVVSRYSYNQLAEMVVSKSNSEDESERRNGKCCTHGLLVIKHVGVVRMINIMEAIYT